MNQFLIQVCHGVGSEDHIRLILLFLLYIILKLLFANACHVLTIFHAQHRLHFRSHKCPNTIKFDHSFFTINLNYAVFLIFNLKVICLKSNMTMSDELNYLKTHRSYSNCKDCKVIKYFLVCYVICFRTVFIPYNLM